MSKKSIPNFLDVFQKRVDSAREKIKEELKKEKSKRDRHLLKDLLEDIRGIRKNIKTAKNDHEKKCPHCGHLL